MAAFLGLRGSGDFTTDERPTNWREMILYLNPNGEAPLTGLLSLLASEGTDDPQFNWWEKELPTQRMALGAVGNPGDTTLTLASGAKDTVAGTILLHEVSGELLRVTTTPTTDTSIAVERSWGGVAAATLASGSFLTVVANVNEEGALPPTAKAYSPVKKFNYDEIFRMSLYMTRTARKTKLRWDNKGPYREAKREALSLHSIEMEKGHIFGEPVESVGPNGKPMRMTGGILSFLVTNIGNQTAGPAGVNFGTAAAGLGNITEEQLDDILEAVFRWGKNEKLMLCGSAVTKAITTLGKRNGFLQMLPTSTTYGMKIIEYTTPSGTLYLKTHPLFNQHPVWRQNGLVLDVDNLVSRPIDDTMFIKNRQQPGEDAAKDEFLTETGLEVHFEKTHAYLQGITGGTAT
jgi:hypothetical protein